MSDGIVARGIQKVRKLLAEKAWSGDLSERQRAQLRAQLQECAEALGGEVSARQRAARLAETYSGLSDAGRAAFLRLIATEFGPQPARVAKAHEAYQAALGTDAQWAAESALRAALRSPRLIIKSIAATAHHISFRNQKHKSLSATTAPRLFANNLKAYWPLMPSSSTSKCSVALGGITPLAPRAP